MQAGIAFEVGAVGFAPDHHFVGEHLALGSGEGNRAELFVESHGNATRLEEPKIVARSPRGHRRFAAEQIVLRAVSRSDIVFGDNNYFFGIGSGLPDDLGFAFGENDTIKEGLHSGREYTVSAAKRSMKALRGGAASEKKRIRNSNTHAPQRSEDGNVRAETRGLEYSNRVRLRLPHFIMGNKIPAEALECPCFDLGPRPRHQVEIKMEVV